MPVGLLALLLLPKPAPAVDRGGFFIGGGAGAGWIECDSCDRTLGGLAAGFHAGWMFGERWGLVGDGSAVLHPQQADSPQVTSAIGGIGARFFLSDRVWIQLVIGTGGLDTLLSATVDPGSNGPALMGGVGFELLQRQGVALDLSARLGSFEDENGPVTNVSFQLRLNLY